MKHNTIIRRFRGLFSLSGGLAGEGLEEDELMFIEERRWVNKNT
jgi:hypothetical protein